jgi:VanZ family protein
LSPSRASLADRAVEPGRARLSAEALAPWGPALLWAAFIFAMSSEALSAEHTGGAIETLVRAVLPWLTEETAKLAHFVIRKGAHFYEYFVFALLLERALAGSGERRSRWSGLGALAIAILYSLSDEAHQLVVPGRTGSLRDCAIDGLGAATALFSQRVGLVRLPASAARR